MKLLALFALFFGARTKTKPHNDNLRAGQYPEPVAYSPWRAFVS